MVLIDKKEPKKKYDSLENFQEKRTMAVGKYLRMIKSGEIKRGDINNIKIKSLYI